MTTPRDEHDDRPNPFAPPPQDTPPYETSPQPAPPPMHSPYRPDEEIPGQEAHRRQPPRFPALHHGSGHGGGQGGGHGQGSGQGTGQGSGQGTGQGFDQGTGQGFGQGAGYANPQSTQQPPRTPPPFEQRSSQGISSGWGTGSGSERFAPPPPQFSYRPEMQPPPPPPAPPASDNRRKVIIGAVAAVVVVGAAVGVGTMMMGGSSTKQSTTGGPTVSMGQDSHTTAPADKSVAAAWSVQAGGDATTVVGSWLVDNKSIVRGDTGALKAYEAESGKSLWTFPAPGQGSTICGMSQLAIRKLGLVQSGPSGSCDTVTAVNTDSGKQVWTAAVAAPPGSAPGTVPLTSFGGDVAAGQAGTSVTVWSAADGHQLWSADLAKANPACRLEQLGVKGAYVTLVEDCGAGPVVAARDSHSGKELWHTPLPPDGLNGAQVTLVQAAFPTIVHVASQGAQPLDKYYSFDTKGKAQATISGTGDFGALDLNTGPQGQQHPLPHVQDTTLVAPTADKDTNAGLVAFDLGSGNKLWQIPAVKSGPVTIAGLDANKVTIFDGGTTDSPARLLAYATKGGAPVASGISGTLGTDWSGPAAAAYVAGDRLIVLPASPEKGADVLAFALG